MSWDEDDSSSSSNSGSSNNNNGGGGGGSKPEFKKTALNEGKLSLRGYKTDEMDYPPTLGIQVVKNQVHITIWTSVKGDERKPISCRYSSPMFFALLQRMHDIEAEPNDTVFSTDNKIRPKDSKEIVLDTKFLIGKDKNGCYFLSGTAKGCTKVQFMFGYEQYHQFFRNGEPLTKSEASQLQFRAYRNLFHALVPAVLAGNFDETPKGDWKGKGKGNYGGGGGGGNKPRGDYGSRDKSFDDDVSF